MADSVGVILQIRQDAEDDAAELAQLAGWLRAELLELEVQSVDPLPSESVPAGAKGAEAIVGWLLVQLGPGVLGTLLAKVADWVTRNDRRVELTIGGEKLTLTRATREQQEKIVDGWLARHAPDA